jgi:hypothetical protein
MNYMMLYLFISSSSLKADSGVKEVYLMLIKINIVVKLSEDGQGIVMGLSDGPNDNVRKILKPEKYFT